MYGLCDDATRAARLGFHKTKRHVRANGAATPVQRDERLFMPLKHKDVAGGLGPARLVNETKRTAIPGVDAPGLERLQRAQDGFIRCQRMTLAQPLKPGARAAQREASAAIARAGHLRDKVERVVAVDVEAERSVVRRRALSL